VTIEPLPGHTLAQDERILRARVGFLAPFYSDPRVAAFFGDLDQ
jgi:hypothetical protein